MALSEEFDHVSSCRAGCFHEICLDATRHEVAGVVEVAGDRSGSDQSGARQVCLLDEVDLQRHINWAF